MLPTLISNSEILYKAIKPIDHLWKQGSPSSAAFKDSKGLSVDRDGGRTKSDCITVLQDRIGTNAIVSFTAGGCRSIGVLPLAKPLIDNPFHAEVHRSATEIPLSSSQARRLRDLAILETGI
jgi:hypothetical protein